MSSAERKFWAGVVAEGNKGWDIALSDGATPGAGMLSNLGFRVYCIDVPSGYTFAGAMSASAVEAMTLDDLPSGTGPAEAKMAAGALIHQVAVQRLTTDAPMASTCLNAVVAALRWSSIYQTAVAHTGSSSGHWLYLCYGCRDGSLLGRPLFFSGDATEGLMPPEEVRACVAMCVEIDQTQNLDVKAKLAQAGGAIIHPEFIPERG